MASLVTNVSLVVVHAAVQTVAGMLAGAVVERAFPWPSAKPIEKGDWQQVGITFVEAIGQLSCVCIIAAAGLSLATSNLDTADPASCLALLYAVQYSSPNLIQRLRMLYEFVHLYLPPRVLPVDPNKAVAPLFGRKGPGHGYVKRSVPPMQRVLTQVGTADVSS